VLNPLLLAGQVHGGMAAGLGQALLEDARYDDATGQLLAGSWIDYAMPRADHMPDLAVATISVPSSNNVLGIKGVGELPANGAPAAVANAVIDALAIYDVCHVSSPMTSERIWRAINLSSAESEALPPKRA
jgi:carbon-monoxide dehydrogenase large subunit